MLKHEASLCDDAGPVRRLCCHLCARAGEYHSILCHTCIGLHRQYIDRVLPADCLTGTGLDFLPRHAQVILMQKEARKDEKRRRKNE